MSCLDFCGIDTDLNSKMRAEEDFEQLQSAKLDVVSVLPGVSERDDSTKLIAADQ